jgi:hypothetical protein
MKVSSIYSKLAKTAALATLAAGALVVSTASQARPQYIQDVQYVQVAPQLVITPPQLVVQAPVYVAPVVRHPRPVVLGSVAYVPGRIYYINGRPYLNGHPYVRGHAYGHYKPKHLNRHHGRDDRFDRQEGRHDEGRHGGQNR